MTRTTHTPGPWECNEVRTTCGRAFRIGSGEMLQSGKGACIIYDDYPGNPENERKANARLIAAAPDLLDALVEAASVLPIAGRLNAADLACIQAQIVAALAKARGEG